MDSEFFRNLMENINKNSMGCSPITYEEGKILNILLEIYTQNKDLINIIEVGTCVGYSAIWMSKGIINSGKRGKIYSFEKDLKRVKEAEKNIEKISKISSYESIKNCIMIINGNAINELPKVEESIDFAFLDGLKEEYIEYLKLLKPNLKQGSIVTAHNVISHKDLMDNFLREINNSEIWDSVIIPTQSGLSISIKKI